MMTMVDLTINHTEDSKILRKYLSNTCTNNTSNFLLEGVLLIISLHQKNKSNTEVTVNDKKKVLSLDERGN